MLQPATETPRKSLSVFFPNVLKGTPGEVAVLTKSNNGEAPWCDTYDCSDKLCGNAALSLIQAEC